MRNDLQGLVLAGNTILVVPVGLSEEEAYLWAKYIERLEDQAMYEDEAEDSNK